MTTVADTPLSAPSAEAQQLAVLLSAAVRIEPQLLRAVRLALLPELDVGAESDLWFSDWVFSRSSELITLDPAIRPHLYERLSRWLRDQGLAAGERLRREITRAHAEISPALQKEEEALWLALSGSDADAIDEAFMPALQALVAQGREGIADWFLGAWERLPAAAQQTRGAWQLAQVTVQQHPGALPPTEAPAELTVGDLAPIADAIPQVRLGVRRTGTELWLGDLTDATAQIMVPDTNPRVIEIADPGDAADARTVLIERGAATRLVIDEAPVMLRTGTGTAYRLAGLAAPPPETLVAEASVAEAPAAEAPATEEPVTAEQPRDIAAYRLRLSCYPDGTDYRVDLLLEGAGAGRTATARLSFDLVAQDRRDIRWYLEDYLAFPGDPAPQLAEAVVARLAEWGADLFRQIFEGSRDAIGLWDRVAAVLPDTRVEIAAETERATALPWELLRDPATDGALALRAGSFVHTHPKAAAAVILPEVAAGVLRVLVVISRPGGSEDIPFRAVAGQLMRLSLAVPEALHFDVLRPPTFARLTRALEEAHAAGTPYHLVHFDGHGAYLDEATLAGSSSGVTYQRGFALVSSPRPGAHGYLVFEDPADPNNQQLVDGPALGRLLARTGAPVLLLNACRSAHAEPDPEPPAVTGDADSHERSYASLAQEVMDAGVAGVVAMRYNVYVDAAAMFTGEVYAALLQGRTLGTAVASARRLLAAEPQREVAGERRPLQDWLVPVVYEATPLTLRAVQAGEPTLSILLDQEQAGAERAAMNAGLPREPDVGFVGRDETLLALDRAFDTFSVVLLHGWAGAGKTATAAEFARWYAVTGGTSAVLFSSFERHLTLARLLDHLADRFRLPLEQAGVDWYAVPDDERRSLALQVLAQLPLLWVWDGVQQVAGFPADTPSEWTAAEQAELADFLHDVAQTRCKVLLTSRRDEREWLGDFPAWVNLPAMRMPDRLELARAVAARQSGAPALDRKDWQPLLQFTQGNPLTVIVLVRQALREGHTTAGRIQDFVDRMRAGAEGGTGNAGQGGDPTLAASLDYGFTQAFTGPERAQLALLALFQGFADVEALRAMGDPGVAGQPVPQIAGLIREAGLALLDRAAGVGLLTAQGDGYYAVHPAVPWYLQNLFTEHYGPPGSFSAEQARRAWTAAISHLGGRHADQYEEGDSRVVGVLAAEEANLLLARQEAIENGWLDLALGPMRGLNVLYGQTGRAIEWRRLVAELLPLLTDPGSGAARPGREREWAEITEYQIGIAIKARDWPDARLLLGSTIAWHRDQAAGALALPPESLTDRQRLQLRDLAAAVGQLASTLQGQEDPGCVDPYREAFELFQRIDARREEGLTALSLGDAYLTIPILRDLDQAEHWYQRAMEQFRIRQDMLGLTRSTARLGGVAYERFLAARAAAEPSERLMQILNDALRASHEALDRIAADAPADLAAICRQLGAIYREAGEIDRALSYYQRAIQYEEQQDDPYGAGQTRYGAALALASAGRLDDAILYARAALRDYETLGPGAAADADRTRDLITHLERGGTPPELSADIAYVAYQVPLRFRGTRPGDHAVNR